MDADLLKFRAEQGDAECQFQLGNILSEDGPGTAQDHEQAAKWYQKAAEQGHAAAQYNLGVLYSQGLGVGQDAVEAAKWFHLATQKRDEKTDSAPGTNAKPDDAESATRYKALADAGDLAALYYVGYNYATGRGVRQDFAEALKCFRKGALQGDAKCQCYLGILYGNGQGVAKDFVLAREWLRKAADQNDAWAQLSLGIIYEKGRGVPQDAEEAYFWYTLAAINKADSAVARERTAALLTPGQKAAADRRAAKWQPLKAQQ